MFMKRPKIDSSRNFSSTKWFDKLYFGFLTRTVFEVIVTSLKGRDMVTLKDYTTNEMYLIWRTTVDLERSSVCGV